ncbi:MAG: hypothetical protein LBJ00_11995 [Planctomycetaceae bacterium]|nr:hypothetical protein [Planctomycetaceae bacterium]
MQIIIDKPTATNNTLFQKKCQHVLKKFFAFKYTVAGKAIGFAPEQPLHVVALTCPAS